LSAALPVRKYFPSHQDRVEILDHPLDTGFLAAGTGAVRDFLPHRFIARWLGHRCR